MMAFEISSVMENDGSVEKAEAYAKELEDVSKLPIWFLRNVWFCTFTEYHILTCRSSNL